jgi:putative ATP-dependent endonuclease of OLD family
MKIKNMIIKNFKTFDSEGINLTMKDLTTLVGENNVGKSNVLEALDIFFNYSKTKINKSSFHHDDVQKEIVIEVTFYKLSDEEKKRFRPHLDEEGMSLTITQKINLEREVDEDDDTLLQDDYIFVENKHGTKLVATKEYAWANIKDKSPTKKDINKWWEENLVIGDFNFKSLFDDPNSVPSPDEYHSNLKKLWEEYYDIIPKEKTTGDDKVLGWKNKLKGNLPKYFYIPAVKKVEEDVKVTKTSPFGEIISWLTQNITQDIREDFEQKTQSLVEKVVSSIDQDEQGESKLGFINKKLNKNLGVDLQCELAVKFGMPTLDEIVFPSPQIIANDGYESDISQKGHGLQRLTIFSLLRTYNDFQIKSKNDLRNIIIGIEEPEIYLHPPIKRFVYSLLRNISEGKDQIIYSTHDTTFVSIENFDEIRLFRKIKESKILTKIYEFSYEKLIVFYKKKFNKDIEEKSLRHRFGYICDDAKSEGFFSNKVVLIEGETEKYSLPIYFSKRSFNLDENRISLISAGSVDLISYLYIIYNEFNIPCYVIFDGDKPQDILENLPERKTDDIKKKSNRNKELLSLLGKNVNDSQENIFPNTEINECYSVWEKNFEIEFHRCQKNYDEIKKEAKELYGTDSKPLTGRFFAEKITTCYPSQINPKIDELIKRIKNLTWKSSCLSI